MMELRFVEREVSTPAPNYGPDIHIVEIKRILQYRHPGKYWAWKDVPCVKDGVE